MTLTYGQYLKVPELLGLQQGLADPAHHDEPLFIIIHQVYELWFKLILHEVDSAAAHLRADRVGEATRLLRRVVEIQRLLISQVRILETMPRAGCSRPPSSIRCPTRSLFRRTCCCPRSRPRPPPSWADPCSATTSSCS